MTFVVMTILTSMQPESHIHYKHFLGFSKYFADYRITEMSLCRSWTNIAISKPAFVSVCSGLKKSQSPNFK